jgi:hypothetical protein
MENACWVSKVCCESGHFFFQIFEISEFTRKAQLSKKEKTVKMTQIAFYAMNRAKNRIAENLLKNQR